MPLPPERRPEKKLPEGVKPVAARPISPEEVVEMEPARPVFEVRLYRVQLEQKLGGITDAKTKIETLRRLLAAYQKRADGLQSEDPKEVWAAISHFRKAASEAAAAKSNLAMREALANERAHVATTIDAIKEILADLLKA
jgi:hypothetical protein